MSEEMNKILDRIKEQLNSLHVIIGVWQGVVNNVAVFSMKNLADEYEGSLKQLYSKDAYESDCGEKYHVYHFVVLIDVWGIK